MADVSKTNKLMKNRRSIEEEFPYANPNKSCLSFLFKWKQIKCREIRLTLLKATKNRIFSFKTSP